MKLSSMVPFFGREVWEATGRETSQSNAKLTYMLNKLSYKLIPFNSLSFKFQSSILPVIVYYARDVSKVFSV